MKSNSKSYIGTGLILASILPLSHGSRLLSAQNTFMQESTQHNASVVDQVPMDSDNTGTVNRALLSVVEFVDDTGARRTAKTNVASYPAPNAIGDEINVRIHNARLDDVRVVSFSGLWFESAFYLVPGFLSLAIGLLILWNNRKPT